MQQFFPYDLPHVNDLERQGVLMLINIHPAIDFAEVVPPNTIPVGGLQIQPRKPLPKVCFRCELHALERFFESHLFFTLIKKLAHQIFRSFHLLILIVLFYR